MTPTDKPMTVDVLEAIAREVGQMERRHCIGKAQGFDVRDAYSELRAAIEQYGREQFIEGNSAAKLMTEVFDSLSSALEREAAATSKPIEDCVPAPPFDPAAEPPWHRSDMGPAGRGSGEPVAVEPIIDAYLDDYETAYDEGSSAPDADTKFVIKDAIMGLLADDEFVKAVTPQPREPLTDEQIDRHTLLAQECPPGSKVILVSSLRRLRAHDIRSAG